MNSSTIAYLLGGSAAGNIASPLSGIGTTETAFSLVAPAVGLGGPAVLSFPSPAVEHMGNSMGSFLQGPFAKNLDDILAQNGAVSFNVRLVGRVQVPAASTAAINLYVGSSATLVSNVKIAGSGAVSFAVANDNFEIEAYLSWDSVSGKLRGSFESALGATVVSPITLSNAASAAAIANIQFVASVAFGTSNAANLAYLDEFAIDMN